MLHPATELKFINEEIGLGVFATEFIPKGTILWVFDSLDIIIPMEKFERLSEQIKKHVRKYGYRINPGDFYTLNWDITRYLNHSCRPNSRSIGNYFDIAVRDIQPGEQITVDYGILNYPDLVCLCGEPNCRGLIKIRRCMEHASEGENLSRRKIVSNIRNTDKSQARIREIMTSAKWGDPSTYDLTVNATAWDINELAVALSHFVESWFDKKNE